MERSSGFQTKRHDSMLQLRWIVPPSTDFWSELASPSIAPRFHAQVSTAEQQMTRWASNQLHSIAVDVYNYNKEHEQAVNQYPNAEYSSIRAMPVCGIELHRFTGCLALCRLETERNRGTALTLYQVETLPHIGTQLLITALSTISGGLDTACER